MKVGRKSSLTLHNKVGVALSVTKQVQVKKYLDHGTAGLLEQGSNWKIESTEYEDPKIIVIGPGTQKAFSGGERYTTIYFGKDVKEERRPIITYIGRESVDFAEQDEEQTNQPDTDPPNPWIDDMGDLSGGYDDYTDMGDTVEAGGTGGLGSRKGTIILLLIVVLLAAGAGWAARGMAMRKMLGF